MPQHYLKHLHHYRGSYWTNIDSTYYEWKACWRGHVSKDNIYGLVAAILSLSLHHNLKNEETKWIICHAPFGKVINCAVGLCQLCHHKLWYSLKVSKSSEHDDNFFADQISDKLKLHFCMMHNGILCNNTMKNRI